MIDFIAAIRAESARFHDVISRTPMDAAVPSCPGWNVAELAWHLAEVQYFWAAIVDGLLADPADVIDLVRPPDEELPSLFERQSSYLVDAVTRRDPDDQCWSWHDGGHNVGWIRRRQAHEALIHRVDAELAAGIASEIDLALAADGVDEVLRVMLDLDNLPEWATYETDRQTAVIELADGTQRWALEMGRFFGTSLNTGNVYDDPALRLIEVPAESSATLRGPAAALNLWLWGRGGPESLSIEGDRSLADLIRLAAAAGTK